MMKVYCGNTDLHFSNDDFSNVIYLAGIFEILKSILERVVIYLYVLRIIGL